MDNFKNVRTAVIGVGSMGQNHARVYNEISNLVCIVDPDERQGKAISKRFDVDWYPDYNQIIGKVDAVSIAVPTIYHLEVARKLIENGINVLVEKPLAKNTHDAQEIVSLSKKFGIILAVGHIERHNEVIKRTKECLKNKEWGDLISLSARRFSSFPDRIRDVGVLFDLSIHDVDIIQSLFGEKPKNVSCFGGKSFNDKFEDHVSLLMQFNGNKIGLCETNWLTPCKVRDLSITTTTHFVVVDYLSQEIKIQSSEYINVDNTNLHESQINYDSQIIKLKSQEPLKSELVDFLSSIVNKHQPLVTGEDGLLAVETVEKALLSLSEVRTIK